jgi:predicted protein tyrosine phosphatase
MNVLFVCTHHVARSPMAAIICRELAGMHSRYIVRSVGIDSGSSQSLTTRDLAWAHVVAVMGQRQMTFIQRRWPKQAAKVWMLDVPDDYDPGEPELRAILTPKIHTLLQHLAAIQRTC